MSYLRATPRGATLLELLVSLALVGVLGGVAVSNLSILENPAITGAAEVLSFFKAARAKAMAATRAYTIRPSGATGLSTTYAGNCGATDQIDDDRLTLDLPSGAALQSTDWFICYNSRGIADVSVDVVVFDAHGSKTVQAVVGGAVRIKPE